MRKINLLACLLLFLQCKTTSDDNQGNFGSKEITIEEIWGGAFSTERMNSLNSMNGDFYSLLNYNSETKSSTVDKYSYETLEKVATIVDGKNLKGLFL